MKSTAERNGGQIKRVGFLRTMTDETKEFFVRLCAVCDKFQRRTLEARRAEQSRFPAEE